MRVLVLTSYVPYPPTSGAKIHVFNQMRYLHQEHEVVLMCPVRAGSGQAEVVARQLVGECCTEAIPVPWRKRSKVKFLPHLLHYLHRGEPPGNLIFYFEELIEALRRLTAEHHFDIVNVYNDYMAPYIEAISPRCRCRKVLSLQNVPHLQWHRMMLTERNPRRKLALFRDWLFQKRATLRHIREYDRVIAISPLDRAILLKSAQHADIAAVPAGVDSTAITPLDKPTGFSDLLLIGSMYYRPNIDAAHFLVREIFPRIRQQVPDAHLFIVGSNPPKEVLDLGKQIDGITVTGYVDSVIPYYEQVCLTLVPLRAGSGVRVKILESMMLGRPVVSTTLGCEGLQVTPDQNILVADTAADFAAQTVRMMTDSELWQRIASNGRRQIERVYDWQVVGEQLVQAFGKG